MGPPRAGQNFMSEASATATLGAWVVGLCVCMVSIAHWLIVQSPPPPNHLTVFHIQVHCCGGAPCERCFRLALPCRPQAYEYVLLQEGASADATTTTTATNTTTTAAADSSSSGTSTQRRWLRRKRGYCRRGAKQRAGGEGEGEGDEEAGWEPIEGSPLLALAFQRGGPRAHAELACEVFMSMVAEGRVARPRALAWLYVITLL